MRKLIPLCSLCFSILAGYQSRAQNRDFAPGYYLTQQGDTLKGYISLGNDDAPATFRFKKHPGDQEPAVVAFDSCRFVTSGKVSLVNLPVRRSMTHIDKMDYTIKLADSSITASIPMRLLYRGTPFSLYHYADVRDHFFIDNGNTVQELVIQYRYLTEWEKSRNVGTQLPAYFIEPVFHQQIVAMMNNQLTKKLKNLLEKTEYNERSLVQLFEALDGSGR